MTDKKKAAPAQSSQLNTSINKINYSKKAVVIKQFKSHMSEYRDCLLATYDCVDDAIDGVLKLINHLQLQQIKPASFKKDGNRFLSSAYSFNIYTADEAIGFHGQKGYFSIARRSASNVFLRLLQWVPLSEPLNVFKCCAEILQAEGDDEVLELINRPCVCKKNSFTLEELLAQYAFQRAKCDVTGFSELALLTTLERLRTLGAKFDLITALQHAYLLSDAFFYSYCDIAEVRYE